MSRNSNRINKLELKNYRFWSKDDLLICADYYKAQLKDENESFEQYANECNQIIKIIEDKSLTMEHRLEKYQEIVSVGLTRVAYSLYLAERTLKNHPNGVFIPKELFKFEKEMVKAAKNYFRLKKVNAET